MIYTSGSFNETILNKTDKAAHACPRYSHISLFTSGGWELTEQSSADTVREERYHSREAIHHKAAAEVTAAITAGSSPPACHSSCQPPQQLSAITGRMPSSQNHSNSAEGAEVTAETPPWKQQVTYSMCLRACKRFHFLIQLPCCPSLAFKM